MKEDLKEIVKARNSELESAITNVLLTKVQTLGFKWYSPKAFGAVGKLGIYTGTPDSFTPLFTLEYDHSRAGYTTVDLQSHASGEHLEDELVKALRDNGIKCRLI